MGLVDSPAHVVLDDHELVRDGMERQLTTDFPGARVVYSGDSLLDALKATATSQCDCAVVDLDLGDQTPVAETVSAFTARGIPVVVVSAMARPDVLQAAMAAGAQAFIAKRSSLRNLSMAVRTVLDGGTWFPPDLAGAVLRTSTSVELSAQEKRALVLYASGLTLEMVARRMEITPNTVKHYLDRVRDKYTAAGIAARTKMQLHQVARLEGLLP
jgi:DNA-binding NarL/FixJ family response regulator